MVKKNNDKKEIKYEHKEEVGIIRDRNQITIPAEFKEIVDWIQKDTPVMLKLEDNKIIIEPIVEKARKTTETDWDRIFKNLEEIRKSSNHKTNLTEFVIKDRETRR